jgi:spore cortex formation protein SpoVR/YcgB (stage V sporulation)
MKDEIKEILDNIRKIIKSNREDDFNRIIYDCDSVEKLLDYITNLQESQETLIKNDNEIINNLQEENERLKDLYRRTCNHLFNIGNDELARYFQAQINECNTFTVQGVGK